MLLYAYALAFFSVWFLSLSGTYYLSALLSSFPMVAAISSCRHLWYCFILVTMAFLSCFMMTSACAIDDTQGYWFALFLATLTLAMIVPCRHFMSVHWKRLLGLPLDLLEFVLAVLFRLVLWAPYCMVSLQLVSLLDYILDAPFDDLSAKIKQLDCPGVFYLPPSLATMRSWDAAATATATNTTTSPHYGYVEGHVDRWAIDHHTNGPSDDMDMDLLDSFASLSIA
ncbi:hypothetical protein BCR42DRAFT_395278 [Absidia repens]|uniref:Uncharacterized protein n=1 Tax=Absidia repens TaxID=90262 RepID=A0A1X2I8W5_9FUNG|nr:hypothetical protein BCR42DRAFT_395278 [Absidia repens]